MKNDYNIIKEALEEAKRRRCTELAGRGCTPSPEQSVRLTEEEFGQIIDELLAYLKETEHVGGD